MTDPEMPRILKVPQLVSSSRRQVVRRAWVDALNEVVIEGTSALVPPRIALCILDLCKMSVGLEHLPDSESAKEHRKIKWLIKLLKHYGGIPEVAKLETSCLELSIHCMSGQARCTIVDGLFKGRSLDSLLAKEMDVLRHVSGSEAAEVVQSYRALRNIQNTKQQV